jgi:hypothetical protein
MEWQIFASMLWLMVFFIAFSLIVFLLKRIVHKLDKIARILTRNLQGEVK